MRNQENSEPPEAGSELPTTAESALPAEGQEQGKDGQPRWREVFRQAFEKARKTQQPIPAAESWERTRASCCLLWQAQPSLWDCSSWVFFRHQTS